MDDVVEQLRALLAPVMDRLMEQEAMSLVHSTVISNLCWASRESPDLREAMAYSLAMLRTNPAYQKQPPAYRARMDAEAQKISDALDAPPRQAAATRQ